MPRYVAFLRAINVGGHIVKMEELRRLFAQLGCSEVETFIASGNVIFNSVARSEEALRRKIETHLEKELGYAVAVFLRSDAELHEVAGHVPFAAAKFRVPESRLFVTLLVAEPSAEARHALENHGAAEDEFRVRGREIYWLCHVRANESKFSGAKLEKTIGMATTVRNVNTIRRLAAKLS